MSNTEQWYQIIINQITREAFGPNVYNDPELLKSLIAAMPIMVEEIQSRQMNDINISIVNDVVQKIHKENFNRWKKADERRLCFEIAFIMLYNFIRKQENAHLMFESLEQLLGAYPEFQDVDETELKTLLTFRNVMKIAQLVISPKNHKTHLLDVATRLAEGKNKKYITGSGQTAATARRVLIYEREGELKAVPRPPRKRPGEQKLGDDVDLKPPHKMPFYDYAALTSDSILMHDALINSHSTRDYFSPLGTSMQPHHGHSISSASNPMDPNLQLTSQLIQPMTMYAPGVLQRRIPMVVPVLPSSSVQCFTHGPQILVPPGTHPIPNSSSHNMQPFSRPPQASQESAVKLNTVVDATTATLHHSYITDTAESSNITQGMIQGHPNSNNHMNHDANGANNHYQNNFNENQNATISSESIEQNASMMNPLRVTADGKFSLRAPDNAEPNQVNIADCFTPSTLNQLCRNLSVIASGSTSSGAATHRSNVLPYAGTTLVESNTNFTVTPAAALDKDNQAQVPCDKN